MPKFHMYTCAGRTAGYRRGVGTVLVRGGLAVDLVVEAAYSGLRGTHLTSRVNLNQIPWATALAGGTTQAARLFPNVGNQVVMDSSTGNSSYNALNLRAEKRLSHG